VFHSLRWPSTNQRLVDHAMSAGVPHINLGILRDFKFVVPPLPLAKAYDQLAGPMRRLAENLSAQNANLRSTRDLLLPKLVSGEVDVSELDIETEWLAS
jgi:type I restriction enzyme S subunit